MTNATVYVVVNVMLWERQLMPAAVNAWVSHMDAHTMGAWRN
jgi:hypothetical protein